MRRDAGVLLRSSGWPIDERVDTATEAAAIIKARDAMKLEGLF